MGKWGGKCGEMGRKVWGNGEESVGSGEGSVGKWCGKCGEMGRKVWEVGRKVLGN